MYYFVWWPILDDLSIHRNQGNTKSSKNMAVHPEKNRPHTLKIRCKKWGGFTFNTVCYQIENHFIKIKIFNRKRSRTEKLSRRSTGGLMSYFVGWSNPSKNMAIHREKNRPYTCLLWSHVVSNTNPPHML